jgi:nicotinamidase-related amidase
MLKTENTVLLIIDIQGKLAHMMKDSEALFDNVQKLIKGVQTLNIPIVWMEQNPLAIGRTVPDIAELLTPAEPIEKLSFSCCGNDTFVNTLAHLNRKQVLLAGIETHICVYQTAADLLKQSYEVHIVADAVSSRTALNRQIGIQKICDMGASLTSVEMALFELLRVADGQEFRKILKIIK